MINESKADRKRRLDKERKQREREEKRQHRIEVGAKEYRFDLYRGTIEALERLKAHKGHGDAELITLLIHAADEQVQRDPSQFNNFTHFSSYAGEAENEQMVRSKSNADKGICR